MHFHLPRPLHGWREFAGEVGIIVLGVLIALGAEQVLSSIHDRSEARHARDNVVYEVNRTSTSSAAELLFSLVSTAASMRSSN